MYTANRKRTVTRKLWHILDLLIAMQCSDRPETSTAVSSAIYGQGDTRAAAFLQGPVELHKTGFTSIIQLPELSRWRCPVNSFSPAGRLGQMLMGIQ